MDRDEFKFRYVDGTTMLNHYFIRLAFMDSWKEVVPEEQQTKVFSRIDDKLNQIAKDNGCLELLVPFVTINAGKS